MKKITPAYTKHVLVCVNLRDNGRDCCGAVCGEELFQALKGWVRSEELITQIWVTRTRCLGFCNPVGTTIAIYPDRIWFTEVVLSDIDAIKTALLK